MKFHKRKIFTSSRSAERRRRHFMLRLGLCIFALFIFAFGVGLASWLPEVTINQIIVAGNVTVPEEDVVNRIEKRIEGGYLGLFSRANVFLFQPHVIEAELKDAFKKIKDVEVSRRNFQSIAVHVTERKPFYLWCDEGAQIDVAQPCYFLDIDGYAFAPAPYFSGNIYFEFHKKFVEGNENPIGTYFLPEAEFKRLIGFRNALREVDIEPRALFILDSTDYSFVLQDGTKIFFHPKQDFDILFHNLAATFDTEQFTNKKKQGFFLEYIDLRFDNKVYYRFK